MITVEFTLFISLILSFGLLLVFVLWIRYNFFNSKEIDDQIHFFQQCPYCTHIFFDYEDRRVKTCPKCKSLLGSIAK
jgi:hypothetical protein